MFLHIYADTSLLDNHDPLARLNVNSLQGDCLFYQSCSAVGFIYLVNSFAVLLKSSTMETNIGLSLSTIIAA